MKQLALTAFGIAFAITHLSARIGEIPAQLDARFGSPIKEALAGDGSGLRVYCSDRFSEIRVTFIEGVSEREVYKYAGSLPYPNALIDGIREDNPEYEISRLGDSIEVRSDRSFTAQIGNLLDPDKDEHIFSGRVTIKSDGDQLRGILRDGNMVVEIPMGFRADEPRNLELTDGGYYSVTVMELDLELDSPYVAAISKREHVDWRDIMDDARLQQLVRITSGDEVVFERSMCRLHRVTMDLRAVTYVGGFPSPGSEAEAYCERHYPSFQVFAIGGCLFGPEDTTHIYICPRCVAECDEYKRQHPQQDQAK